jgi:OOP family OmpA-OmpF porin
MKKLLITSLLFAAMSANANLIVVPNAVNNWVSANGQPVKNSTGQCWRNSSWTPATAHPDCDGALKPIKVAEASKPAQVDITKPTATIAQAASTPPVVKKVSYSADTFFDFDKSILKPEGKQALDSLVTFISTINLEVAIVVGHTDSIGTDAYNMKLGTRRAEAVKAYLISKGLEKSRVYTESKGESKPVADNRTSAGRAKNRRVEVEVVGTAK